jgi:hypothetical protein
MLASDVDYSPHLSHANAAVLEPQSPDQAVLEIRGLKALDQDKVVDKTRVAGKGEIADNPSLKRLH